MALIRCPECSNEVSDRAATCPHCGFPIANLTNLHNAVAQNDIVMIQDLIRAGFDVNATDSNGNTPLMIAASRSNFDAVKVLLQAGADVNRIRGGGNTALMDAAFRDDSRIVRVLLDAGADFKMRNDAGQSALDIATKKKRKEAKHLLQQAEARAEIDHVLLTGTMPQQQDEYDPTAQSVYEIEEAIVIPETSEQQNVESTLQTDGFTSTVQPPVLEDTESRTDVAETAAEPVEKPGASLPLYPFAVPCLSCGETISARDIACPACRTPIVRKYCRHCSHLIPEHAELCPYCATSHTSGWFGGGMLQRIAIAIAALLAIAVLLAGQTFLPAKTDRASQETSTPITTRTSADPPTAAEPLPTSPEPLEVEPAPQDREPVKELQPNRRPAQKNPATKSARTPKRASSVSKENSTPTIRTDTTSAASKIASYEIPGITIRKSLKTARRLNDIGFRLMQQGRYHEAVVVLRQSLQAYPAGARDPVYAYALYNLGRSLRLAGRPDAAVPILEERMKINNQRDVVARELQAAKRELGTSRNSDIEFE